MVLPDMAPADLYIFIFSLLFCSSHRGPQGFLQAHRAGTDLRAFALAPSPTTWHTLPPNPCITVSSTHLSLCPNVALSERPFLTGPPMIGRSLVTPLPACFLCRALNTSPFVIMYSLPVSLPH